MYRIFLISVLLVSLLSSCTPRGSQHLQKAEELSRQGNVDEAIAEYRLHMRERERHKSRPEWENPSFYLILVGDLELHRNNVQAALQYYLDADKAHVDAALVSDRLRSVSNWYEQKGQLKEAFDLLQKYRERDPLLFDPTLDRLAKQITQAEEH